MRNGKKGSKFIKACQLLAMAFLLLVFGVVFYRSFTHLETVEAKIEKASFELYEQQNILKEFEKEIEYQDSDWYIEKKAREILGYVKENEVVFKIK